LSLFHVHQTVPETFSFSKKATDGSPELEYIKDDDGDDDVYHRRIVHFSEKIEEKDNQAMRSTPPDQTRKFGWDHHDFARSVDP